LLREIRKLGYQGSSSLLVRYISQGRRSPRRAARILLTRPDRLIVGQHQTLTGLAEAYPEMTALTSLIATFAALPVPDPATKPAPPADFRRTRRRLPHVHSFTCGPGLDIQAATARQ
jgi:hypothetical protein